MKRACAAVIGHQSLGVLFDEGTVGVRADADLIRLFVSGHNEVAEAAFAAMITRHGPMVLGECRRIVRDENLAEDAFQIVFWILARKARSVRVDDSIGGWLRGVTRRVAARARASAVRQITGLPNIVHHADTPVAEAIRHEVRHIVGLEVGRLPRKYRDAVVLFHLDGLSHEQTAEALGLPVGTIRSRLARGRDLLRSRLVRRGLAPAALAAWLEARPAAAVPTPLIESAVRNAVRLSPDAISPSVIRLAQVASRFVLLKTAVRTTALLAAIGCATAGTVMLAMTKGRLAQPNENPQKVTAGSPAPKRPP